MFIYIWPIWAFNKIWVPEYFYPCGFLWALQHFYPCAFEHFDPCGHLNNLTNVGTRTLWPIWAFEHLSILSEGCHTGHVEVYLLWPRNYATVTSCTDFSLLWTDSRITLTMLLWWFLMFLRNFPQTSNTLKINLH